MELKQLQYFKAVVTAGGVSKASEALHISQPSLSSCIKRLETDLNIELFSRSKGKLQLTPSGAVFLEHVNRALYELDIGMTKAGEVAQKRNSRLTFSTNIQSLLSDIAVGYQASHPDICIHSHYETAERIRNQILNYEIELAMTDIPIEGPELTWEPVICSEMLLLVHRDNALASRQAVSVRELESQRFVSCEASTTQATLDICRSAGFEPDMYYMGHDPYLRKTFFDRDAAVSFIPAHLAQIRPEGNTAVVPISDCNYQYTVGIVRRTDMILSPLSEDFYKYLTGELKKRGGITGS